MAQIPGWSDAYLTNTSADDHQAIVTFTVTANISSVASRTATRRGADGEVIRAPGDTGNRSRHVLAVLLAGWFLLIKPASSEDLEEAGRRAAAGQQPEPSDADHDPAIREEKLPQEQSELAKLAQKVPDRQLPSLLRQMQYAAVDSGVKLNGITPTLPAPLAGAVASTP